MAHARRASERKESALYHRARYPFRRRAGRTGNILYSRSERQCARIQGIRRQQHFRAMNPRTVALGLGGVALALILGALCFQYLAHFAPCEMCHWQRWPLFAAIAVAILAGAGAKDGGIAPLLAILAILLVAA